MTVTHEMWPQATRVNAGAVGNLSTYRVLVVGLGRFGGGVGVTRWLASQGARVTVTDQAGESSLADSLAEIADLGVRLRLGGHTANDLDDVDLVIVNPAVAKTRSDFFKEILRRNVPWTTEMNLFCERCPAPVVGVTGTFGKSTTSAMIAAALEGCRASGSGAFTTVHLGGNIGVSLLPELERIRPTDVVILEMSNAQLEDLPRINWGPFGAVLTNLVPHHLDRYDGSFDAYSEAKMNLFRRPEQTHWLVHGPIHPQVAARLSELTPIGNRGPIRVQAAVPPVQLTIPGNHNQENAACALAVCRAMGLSEVPARAALAAFCGLPHRLEFVRTLDGVDYYNDSKSTAPSATVVALRSLDRPVVCIVGGQEKPGVELDSLAAVLADRCRAVVCSGDSGPTFASALRGRSFRIADGAGAVREVPTLADAVAFARKTARPGDIVLLSPGAPSFDSYKNFVQRGEHFASLVNALS